MHESKEKSTHKFQVLLSTTKQGDAGDMEYSDAVEELGDTTKVDEALLGHQQMQVRFERLAVLQDELARRKQMLANRIECN